MLKLMKLCGAAIVLMFALNSYGQEGMTGKWSYSGDGKIFRYTTTLDFDHSRVEHKFRNGKKITTPLHVDEAGIYRADLGFGEVEFLIRGEDEKRFICKPADPKDCIQLKKRK